MEMRGARRVGVVVVLCGFVAVGTPFVGGIPNGEIILWPEKETLNKQSVTCQTVPLNQLAKQIGVTWVLYWFDQF